MRIRVRFAMITLGAVTVMMCMVIFVSIHVVNSIVSTVPPV